MSRLSIKTKIAALVGVSLALSHVTALGASVEKGKLSYMAYGCFQCHGTLGQGGTAGPKLAPNPMPFEALANFVRTTDRQMPPYRQAVLPDDDLADIYAYLQSMPAVRDYKSLPLLRD